jgi:hypothetical protein
MCAFVAAASIRVPLGGAGRSCEERGVVASGMGAVRIVIGLPSVDQARPSSLRACSGIDQLPENPWIRLPKRSLASRSERRTFGALLVVRLGWARSWPARAAGDFQPVLCHFYCKHIQICSRFELQQYQDAQVLVKPVPKCRLAASSFTDSSHLELLDRGIPTAATA